MVDRAMMSIPKVRARTHHHLRNLLLSGVVLAALLSIVSVVGLVNEAVVARSMMKKSNAQTAVQQFSIISSNLYEEMQLRILSPDKTNEIATASDAWQTAFKKVQGTFNEELTSSVIQIAEMFEDVTDTGEILYTYVYLLSMLTAVVFLMLHDTYSDRASATTESLAMHSAHAGVGSLFSRIIYYVAKPQDYPVAYQGATGLFMQYVVAAVSPYFSLRALTMANKHTDMLEYGIQIYEDTAGYNDTSQTVQLLSLNSMSGYVDALVQTVESDLKYDAKELESLYYFVVATVLILIAFMLCCMVFCCYWKRSQEGRELASTFEDPDALRKLRGKYMAILQDLRAVGDAEHRSNIVNRVYSIAACWMDVLRTLTPQLLFGAYPDHSRDWSLLEQEVHLSVGKTRVCRESVIMEVSISVHADEQRPFYERELSEQLELLNELYRIVVNETNAAGGVVLGLRGNVSVLCAWNTTNISRHASLLAVRAAHCMQYRLKDVSGMPRVLIALSTGRLHIGTFAVSTGRHYVCGLGSPLGYLQSFRVGGEALGSTLVLDRKTVRRLPRHVSRLMKPLLVLRVRSRTGVSNVVMYSGDDARMEKVELRMAYVRCFSLYQNNLLNESIVSFEKYLRDTPDDTDARWVFEMIVKPRFHISVTQFFGEKRVFVERADAVRKIEHMVETYI